MNALKIIFRGLCIATTLRASILLAAPTTQQSIDQLQADDPTVRTAAETRFRALGKSAIEPLTAATTDPRPEVRARARRALRRIQLFLLPDVPENVLSIAQAYLDAAEADSRHTQLNQLFQIQPQPNAVLTRLIALEPDEDLRHQIFYRLRTAYRDQIGPMLVNENDPDQVLSLLSGAADMWGQGEGEAADNAVAQYLSGNVDAQIQLFKAEQANGNTQQREHSASQLCFLYRISGRSNEALQAARESREPALIFLTLTDQGDWDHAATEAQTWQNHAMGTAFRIACLRLGGHRDLALEASQAMLPNDVDDSFVSSKYLLLNDQPQRGLDMLVDRHPAAVFSMLVERGQIDQAIALAGKYSNHPLEGALIAKLKDELQRTLGEMPSPPTPDEQPIQSSPLTKAWQAAVNDLAQKNFQLAADEFSALWETDHTRFDWLYLQGYALKSSGQAERGTALMHTAEMIPLGDPLRRWQFANQLEAAGLSDVAEQQRALSLHTGKDFDEIGFSQVWNTRAEIAIDHKQWRTANEGIDRLCLMSLSTQLQWQDPTRLITLPALAHLLKSRDLREHGDLAAALAELDAYQNYLPASSDMIIEWVPALDDLGQHQKADALFNGVFEKINAICGKYPDSVNYQNQLAWMCACCGRKLDDAMSAAESATRLKPDNWQTMDTLAEVHFRKGDRAAAIDIEKHASALSNEPYLARQLKRFESAAVPSTTQPGVAPD